MADAWSRANTWEVVSLDPEVDLSVVGDQPLTGWSETKPASLSTSATLGASAPTVQWTAGGLRTVQCSTALVARDYLCSEIGFGCSAQDIDDAYTITAANACDAQSMIDGAMAAKFTAYLADVLADLRKTML